MREAESQSLLLLLILMIAPANKVHDTLLGHMGSGRRAAFDLSCLPLGSSNSLVVLGMVLINRGSVDILIVVGPDAKEALILGKLIPYALVGRSLQASICLVSRVGYPGLQNTFASGPRVRDGCIGTK